MATKKAGTPNLDSVVPPASIVNPNGEAADAERAQVREDWLGDMVELDAPEFQTAKWTVYRVNDDGSIPDGSGVGKYCGKMEGPLDLERLRERWGGGTFRLICSLPDRTRKWTMLSIEGPPRVEPVAQPEPATPAAADPVMQRLDQLAQELTELKRAPAPAAVNPMEMFAQAVAIVRESSPPPTTQLFEIFEKGLKLGQKSEGSNDESLGGIVREALPAVLESFRAPRAAPQPGAQPGAAPAGPAVDRDTTRKRVLVGILVDAIDRSLPAAELVETAEHVMHETELIGLVAATPDQVLQAIGAPLVKNYPQLTSDAGKSYLAAFLDELRRDDTQTPDITPAT